jgi:hypothetical protein
LSLTARPCPGIRRLETITLFFAETAGSDAGEGSGW